VIVILSFLIAILGVYSAKSISIEIIPNHFTIMMHSTRITNRFKLNGLRFENYNIKIHRLDGRVDKSSTYTYNYNNQTFRSLTSLMNTIIAEEHKDADLLLHFSTRSNEEHPVVAMDAKIEDAELLLHFSTTSNEERPVVAIDEGHHVVVAIDAEPLVVAIEDTVVVAIEDTVVVAIDEEHPVVAIDEEHPVVAIDAEPPVVAIEEGHNVVVEDPVVIEEDHRVAVIEDTVVVEDPVEAIGEGTDIEQRIKQFYKGYIFRIVSHELRSSGNLKVFGLTQRLMKHIYTVKKEKDALINALKHF